MPGAATLLVIGCLFLVSHYQYISHIPSPSSITLSKKEIKVPLHH